jgi:hypothetical protein
MAPRIALIHAIRSSIDPIASAFAEGWPEARVFNLLDDSLLGDSEVAGGLTSAIRRRIQGLAHYAIIAGADAILFTGSAFGPAIDEIAKDLTVPALKPYDAMLEEAFDRDRRFGLVATYAATVALMRQDIAALAAKRKVEIDLETALAPGALAALEEGRVDEHNRLVAEAFRSVSNRNVVLLAQYSMMRALPRLYVRPGQVVLTAPGAAVRKLKAMLG